MSFQQYLKIQTHYWRMLGDQHIILKAASNWKESSIYPVFPVGIQDEEEIYRSFPADKWRRNGIIRKSTFITPNELMCLGNDQ